MPTKTRPASLNTRADVQHVTRPYMEERGALEPVGNDELVRRVRAGDVALIDVRPPGALDAVDLLRRKGFRARRVELGVPEWLRGWRVETGDDRHAGGRP